jgi:hypothetical protein
MQWVQGDSFPGVKLPGREADYSLSPRAEARVSVVVLPLLHTLEDIGTKIKSYSKLF